MKILIKSRNELKNEGRWDIDYHLPPEGIKIFPDGILKSVSTVACIVKEIKDPTKTPTDSFIYIDISCVDVRFGVIENPRELTGEEAPSRARKLVKANDIIISTCRPTRGAIAMIPQHLDGQICSTGFSVLRAKKGINPFFLHYALRLSSTLEQFRKWSTGSSYPAILDEDVEKTKVPVPDKNTQDLIANQIHKANQIRNLIVHKADSRFQRVLDDMFRGLSTSDVPKIDVDAHYNDFVMLDLARNLYFRLISLLRGGHKSKTR